MLWELAAIWIIVAATVVWFIRDERRLRFEKLNERARAYATAPAWRHQPAPIRRVSPQAAERDLTDIQRKFLEEMRRQRQR
ncbi:hypothetical protein SAMN06295905_3150 [Devosia lucknowensis]|uniref:Uncharacterized protein n=1 Tax=Devosia lucknowensis TaxID=1096929 RepID=A0A1Y6GBL4_9HYPH|nr:hypothetical protein [Devosia lucknowensis]SMQ85857.1 hypothetical protein SAMN06295905_3150 [Devosia lucknowensis]